MARTTYMVYNHRTGETLGTGLTRKAAMATVKSSGDTAHVRMYPEFYVINDTIFGEKVEFDSRIECEIEAQRRLSLHQSGYSIRRNYVRPISNAVLKVKGRVYTICIE